jgi:hypothetical protein
MVLFGAAFEDLRATLRRQQEAGTAAETGTIGQPSTNEQLGNRITQTVDSDDEYVQPELPVNPANVMPAAQQQGQQDAPAYEGLGMSRNDWLQIGDLAPPPLAERGEEAQTPMPRRRGEDPPGTPASARKVLNGRLLSAQQTKNEFGWQQGAGASTAAANKFRGEIITSPPYLCVFVCMTEGSPFVNVLHSVAKYFHIASSESINNKVIAFAGDRTEFQEPYPVKLPPESAWVWKEVDVCLDAATAGSWYEAHGRSDVCWLPNDLANKQRMSLPRMLFLPTVLASFAMSKNRTPWEIYEEANRLLVQNVISDEEDLQLIQQWCLAAGQTTSATRCSPALKMEVMAISERDEHFSHWAYNLLNSTLGRKDIQSVRVHGTPNGTEFGGNSSGMNRAFLDMAKSMQTMARQYMETTKSSQPATAVVQKADTNAFTVYMLAALMGFSHITEERKVEPIWAKLLNSKNCDDHRSNLERRMKEIAKEKGLPYDKRVYYPDKMIKALIEMKPNAGEGLPTYASAGKALSIMANRPSSTAEIEDMKMREKAERETLATRSFSEAIQIESGGMKLPPSTLDQLTKCVSMFTLLCLALYGDNCDFAKRLLEIWELLDDDDIAAEEHRFTPMYCKQIVWAIHVDKCAYFSHRLMPEDFAPGKTPKFKKSLLWDVIHKLRFTNPIDRGGSFPDEWMERIIGPKAPPQLDLSTPAGKSPFLQDGTLQQKATPRAPKTLEEKLSHVHDFIRESLADYHRKFNGRVMLKKLLELGGKEWSDLPMMEGYVNTQTNKNTMCYNHILGFCSGNRCRFKHVPKQQVTLEFARRMCHVVAPGAQWLVMNETAAPGNSEADKLGKRDGPSMESVQSNPPKKGKGNGKGTGTE